ncbi:hypothetical protein [Wielerella bovis]|uniref:hypothetical protein n=1 Tax=Wielerella bovis TaxID=2917790 RepID=UPI0020196D88|nr:hypothetical protein [Wielerella bovis]ULJ67884.1 hypothetical protein MIS31_04910 [Wielerella bovis]
MTTVYISKDVEVALCYEELSDLCLELSDDEQAKLDRMLLEDAPLAFTHSIPSRPSPNRLPKHQFTASITRIIDGFNWQRFHIGSLKRKQNDKSYR